MRVLITGSAGFVGRHFVKRLQEKHDLVQIDLRDPYLRRDARHFFQVSNLAFDLVIHLAAVVGGRNKIENHPLDLAVDLSLDSDLFQWALRTRPKRIIYYSSSAVYPVRLQRENGFDLMESDLDLDKVQNPDMLYGWAKLTGEMLARYAEAEGLRVHVFRPFSGYGEDQSLDYPFPKFIQRAKDKQNPFEIWGDGNQVRDFIHIDDVVEATIEAVNQDIRGPVNLGWGRPTSFNDLAQMVCAERGYMPRFKHLKAEPVGVRYRVSNPTKMLSFYKPKITLEEGIARALDE